MTMTAKPNCSELSPTEDHTRYHKLHMDGSAIENIFPPFISTIFMHTEKSFMTARKPDVSAELVLGLFVFASLFPASQFENPYYFK